MVLSLAIGDSSMEEILGPRAEHTAPIVSSATFGGDDEREVRDLGPPGADRRRLVTPHGHTRRPGTTG
jgi:hypothetical protein